MSSRDCNGRNISDFLNYMEHIIPKSFFFIKRSFRHDITYIYGKKNMIGILLLLCERLLQNEKVRQFFLNSLNSAIKIQMNHVTHQGMNHQGMNQVTHQRMIQMSP